MANVYLITLEGDQLDVPIDFKAIQKGATATLRFMEVPDTTAGLGGCSFVDPPELGDPYPSTWANDIPATTGELFASKITEIDDPEMNGRKVYEVEYRCQDDLYDPDDFTFKMGGEIIAIEGTDIRPVNDWVWDSDDASIFQPLFKSVCVGTVSVKCYVLPASYEDFIEECKNCLGRINNNTPLTHPALAPFAEGQLLFVGGSDGRESADIQEIDQYEFQLDFAFRFINETTSTGAIIKDDWLYVWRGDTAERWDQPKNGTDFRYEKADLEALFGYA